MDVKSCRDCGRIFNYIGGPRLCVDCRVKLDEKFAEVKKYIEEHKNATIPEVSKEMEVSTKQITQWIREERLAFSEDSTVTFNCDSCGVSIRTGRYCDRCKSEMTRQLGSMYSPAASPTNNKSKNDPSRMRYLNNQ